MGVFIIAEAATTWRYGDELATAERSIKAAADCGASAWKTQWTSDPVAMAKRRSVTTDYSRLAWSAEWLPRLKAMCDAVGVEFMCTVYLPQDIAVIAPLVRRFKVSAFESGDGGFLRAHPKDRSLFVSLNPGKSLGYRSEYMQVMRCVSEYPTPLEKLGLYDLLRNDFRYSGVSDHSTSTLTGAVCVAYGIDCIEKHVKLGPLGPSDPDYGHSLWLNAGRDNIRTHPTQSVFWEYVQNIREAESML